MKKSFLALFLISCSAPDMSRETLRKAGFTDIEITGWELWSCGKDDTWSTGFKAKNPQGLVVEGTVCCGMVVKDCTVRF